MLRPVQTPGPSAPAALWPKGQLPHNTQQTWVCQRLKVKAPEHCSSTTGSSGSRSRFLLCRRMWLSFKLHVLTREYVQVQPHNPASQIMKPMTQACVNVKVEALQECPPPQLLCTGCTTLCMTKQIGCDLCTATAMKEHEDRLYPSLRHSYD